MRYIKGTSQDGLTSKSFEHKTLEDFSDADFANVAGGKSVSGYTIFHNCLVP